MCSETDEGTIVILMLKYLVSIQNDFLGTCMQASPGLCGDEAKEWIIPVDSMYAEHLISYNPEFLHNIVPLIAYQSLEYGHGTEVRY
jgi:hypothetical protein